MVTGNYIYHKGNPMPAPNDKSKTGNKEYPGFDIVVSVYGVVDAGLAPVYESFLAHTAS